MKIKILGMFLITRGITSTTEGKEIEPMKEYVLIFPDAVEEPKSITEN